MNTYYVQVPAYIYVYIDAEAATDITGDDVWLAVGKFPELKAGENFDVDDFKVISEYETDI